jgi:ABC-type glycerol-3-phosphate transport system substrate-binding protein
MSWKMCIRKDWLDQLGLSVPTTWSELKEVAVAMTDAPNRYGFDLPMSKTALKSREWLNYFMRTNNAYYFDKNGKCTFNSPETIENRKVPSRSVQIIGKSCCCQLFRKRHHR